jgi:hypothetical protein
MRKKGEKVKNHTLVNIFNIPTVMVERTPGMEQKQKSEG